VLGFRVLLLWVHQIYRFADTAPAKHMTATSAMAAKVPLSPTADNLLGAAFALAAFDWLSLYINPLSFREHKLHSTSDLMWPWFVMAVQAQALGIASSAASRASVGRLGPGSRHIV
jgi:hypothetical protein